MKEKVVMLIIGILIGAIITTTGFIIYTKFVVNVPQAMLGGPGEHQKFNQGERPEMPNENFNGNMDSGENANGENSNADKREMKGGMQEGNPNKQKDNKKNNNSTEANL